LWHSDPKEWLNHEIAWLGPHNTQAS
jgi:hypothetical protein